MSRIMKRIVSMSLAVLMVFSVVAPQTYAYALTYSGSSSYKSGKYYKNLTKVQLTGNQRKDIVNVAKSQVGYQEGASSSKLSGEVKGSGNYTEYGRWYGMQDMWCAMFVSWCANVAGVSKSIVPSHSYTPTGLSWFKNKGQAYSRATVAKGNYTPQAGDIIYFKSSRNSNTTNHIGIVTGYSNGKVYTIEGNTSSATISTNGGAVCEKSYAISNTYIVYICKPAYKDTSVKVEAPTNTEWLTGTAKDIVFDADYYVTKYPELKSQYGTDKTKLFNHFLNTGIKEGRSASPVFDVKYYVENNASVKEACGTDYVAAVKHFMNTGINEALVTAKPLDLGQTFQAKIGYPSAGYNFSLSDTNVITYTPSDKPAQTWTFEQHPSGAYRIINSKNGYSLAVEGYVSESNVFISEYQDSRRQLWYIYEAADGRYVFRSMAASGCVLDVYGSSKELMADIWTYNYNGSDAQKFTLDKVGGIEEMTPVNLGNEFIAKINASEGMNLSLLNDTDVIIYGDSTAAAQLWKFVLQSDGSYEIINQKNGKLLDVYWEKGISQTNVQIYEDHDGNGQRWFIYQSGDQYIFRPVCSNTCVLDVEGNGTAELTNVQTYVYNGSEGQRFNIVKQSGIALLGSPVNIGNDFYAKITASEGMNLSLDDDNVIIYGDSNAAAQVWKFSLQADGSYKIVNQKTGTLLDVYWEKDESGTNVEIYRDHDGVGQKWYIYQVGGQYIFRPQCSASCVLDVTNNGTANMTNVQIYEYSGSDAQLFSLNVVGNYVDLGTPADLGTEFYAKINVSAGMNLSLDDSNVIIYNDSTAPAQLWKFVRQSNGSYEIANQKTGQLLDVYWEKDEAGTNVQIYNDHDGNGQRWYIYQVDGQYVLRPMCTYTYVLNVAGNATAALSNVQIDAFTNTDGQKFNLVMVDPATEINKANMVAFRNIMYAVETGGQVYGKADYSDFTEAYTNTPEEHAITIGAGQWYGDEAKELLNRIRKQDAATFAALDTAGIAADLDTVNWSEYQLTKDSAKAKCIQAIISSEIGKKCQDELMDEQLTKYLKEAESLGVTDLKAQMMCANIRHLGGLSAVKRILAKTEQPYTMDAIYNAMQSDTGNQVGTFKSRNSFVYNALNEYIK